MGRPVVIVWFMSNQLDDSPRPPRPDRSLNLFGEATTADEMEQAWRVVARFPIGGAWVRSRRTRSSGGGTVTYWALQYGSARPEYVGNDARRAEVEHCWALVSKEIAAARKKARRSLNSPEMRELAQVERRAGLVRVVVRAHVAEKLNAAGF